MRRVRLGYGKSEAECFIPMHMLRSIPHFFDIPSTEIPFDLVA
jgi:hypothetical protein